MKDAGILVFIIYFFVMNIIGFAIMGTDKKRASKNQWRISERSLILYAFLGGSLGTWIGMKLFRHKTKHMKFIILVPMALLLHLAVIIMVFITL